MVHKRLPGLSAFVLLFLYQLSILKVSAAIEKTVHDPSVSHTTLVKKKTDGKTPKGFFKPVSSHTCGHIHHQTSCRALNWLHVAQNVLAFNPNDPGSWITESTNGTPAARHEGGFVEVNGKFYMMGGRDNRPVNIYDPATKTWTTSNALPKKPNGETLYMDHFQAVALNGLIYVIGAFTGDFPHETPVPNVYIYNPANNTWTIGPEIPANRRRGAAGLVAYNGKLYVVCGIIDGHYAGHVSWLDEFDPATNQWRVLPDANFARDHFHAAVVGNKLYATGGRRTSDATGQLFELTVPEVDVFDFATGQWLSYPNGMSEIPTQRAGTSVAVLGNEVIVIGGESGSYAPDKAAHDQAEALNTSTGQWRPLANLNRGRHGTQAITYNNKIYIAAGSGNIGGGPELNSLEVFQFNATAANWTQQAQALGRRAEGQSVVYNGKIYVFNGFGPDYAINNSNEVYDPATNQWSGLAPMPNDPVTHNGIAVVGNTIWIVGGRVGNSPGPVTDKVWIYNIGSNTWSAGPTLPEPLAGGGVVRLGRRLHLFGGFGPSACNNDRGDHFVYDLDNPGAGWQNILAPLPNPRNHFGTTTVGGKIYAIGGQYGHDCDGGQDVSLVHVYDPVTNAWTKLADLPYPNSHLEPGTFAVDGKILVAGGETNGLNVLQYDPASGGWTVFDQLPTSLLAPSAKVVDNRLIVSHGGAPFTDNPQQTTYAKSITRTRSNVLAFSGSGLSVTAQSGSGPVSKKLLLWTLTGSTSYSVATNNLPAWLSVTAGSGTTDESGADVGITINPSAVSPGTYTHTLTASAPGYTNATTTITLTVSGGGQTGTTTRINAGGPAVNTNGTAWGASQYLSGGTAYRTYSTSSISGTDQDEIYLTEYYGPTLKFEMPVPASGTYTVKLHFAEIYWGAPGGGPGGAGKRVFSVNVEGGATELVNYDIYAEVGAVAAVVKSYTVAVNDGKLTVDFTSSVDQAKISAIEVVSSSSAPNQAPVLAAIGNKSVVKGQTLSFTASATDPDGNALSYSLVNAPAGATINATTGAFAWTPASSVASGNYTFSVKVTDNGSPALSDEKPVTVAVSDPATGGTALFRLNAGGGAYTTGDSKTFSGDANFSGGSTYAVGGDVANTTNDPLYQTERYGSFSYNLPVSNGTYSVILHFNELYWGNGNGGGVGSRKFHVDMEGQRKLTDYDVFAKAGGAMKAVTETVGVTVSDGTLNIAFVQGASDQPKVSAIEVLTSGTVQNQAPVLAAIGAKSVEAGKTLNVPLSASDPDGDAVTLSATNLPAFGTFSNNTLTFSPGSQVSGTYQITAKATDSKGATDEETFTLTVSPAASSGPAVTGLILINADTDQDIRPLTANDVINLATLPTRNIAIRANTNPAPTGSVSFVLSGTQSRTATESAAPYALFGDNGGDYNPWTPVSGSYSLRATAYTSSGASGAAGTPLTISFTVTNGASARIGDHATLLTKANTASVYPNPARETATLDLSALPDGPLSVSIVDAFGRKVMQLSKTAAKQITLNVRSLPAGVYHITIQTATGVWKQKLIKQ